MRCGLPGVRMAGERLICVFLDWSNELMATSRCEHAQAEAVLLEAQPVSNAVNGSILRCTAGLQSFE